MIKENLVGRATRVWIVEDEARVVGVVQEVLRYFGRGASYEGALGERMQEGDGDFFILSSSDWDRGLALEPNVVFLREVPEGALAEALLRAVADGGIVVYPEGETELLEEAEGMRFFRREAYPRVALQDGGLAVETDWGHLALPSGHRAAMESFWGVVELCRHLGVMPDEFYEAVLA
ncbi:hypothetical protein [Bergeyella sp. RCAD1439]|uniref:hypothetical protein n=1 Tax=Bergeyella anatis TaxID=3113737 RepID=UPI002E174A74|nr:hypothetical protein [Bergeyella sp. RCAD1439]